LLFALVVALALSVGATYVFYLRVKHQAEQNLARTKKVVAAAAALQPGAPLTAQNLTLIDWPANVPIQGTFSRIDELAGRTVIYPIAANEPVRVGDLANSGSGIGVSAKIPEGMRAVAVKTNEINNVAGFLYPGAHVDVLVTTRAEANQAPVTKTVLQDVQVLTVGARTDADPSAKPENANVVTLLLAPQDSTRLVLAITQGTIQFVLRNGGDKEQVIVPPVNMAELVGVNRPDPAPRVTRVRRGAKPDLSYSVETVAGEKRTVAKFDKPAEPNSQPTVPAADPNQQ
jgi:pilus assembly protein CpaB